GGRGVGVPGELVGVVGVVVGGSDVEVTEDREGAVVLGSPLFQLRCGGRAQRLEPAQFVVVVCVAGLASVRHVHRPDPHSAAGDADGTGFGRVVVVWFVDQSAGDGVQPDTGHYGHTVPASRAVCGHFVTGGSESLVGKVLGAALQLLQTDHIRGRCLQPGHQTVESCVHRVHVPRRDAHGRRIAHGAGTACGGPALAVTGAVGARGVPSL